GWGDVDDENGRVLGGGGVRPVPADPALLQSAQADRQGAGRARRRDPQGARRGAAPAPGGADAPHRLPEQASQRRPGTEAIVEQARREAEAFAHETKAALKESLERRTKIAQEKIERAEAQAMDEVRATAVDVALAAAEKI